MTDLQKLYARAREGDVIAPDTAGARALRNAGMTRKPRGHYAALRHVARSTGIDPETIDRCLKRARRTDAIEAKRGKREQVPA